MSVASVAVVSTTNKIAFYDLQKAVQALQVQIQLHVKQFWNVDTYKYLDAEIKAYSSLQGVPFGSWVVLIQDKIDTDSYGYHYLQEQAQPYAPVNTPYAKLKYSENWSLILSHEVIEMLLNPFLENFRYTEIDGKKVRLVVEPSDPAQFQEYGYKINNVLVSDFVTPNFYDLFYTPNTQYSYTGQIKKPLELLENGYFSFQYLDRLEIWFQMWKVKGKTILKNLTESANNNTGFSTSLAVILLVFIFIFSRKKNEK